MGTKKTEAAYFVSTLRKLAGKVGKLVGKVDKLVIWVASCKEGGLSKKNSNLFYVCFK